MQIKHFPYQAMVYEGHLVACACSEEEYLKAHGN